MSRRTIRTTLLALLAALLCAGAVASAQDASEPYTKESEHFSVELPSGRWKSVTRPDGAHHHTEFIYGERSDGYLRIRREVVEAGTKLADVARRDEDVKLRFMPGFVGGKQNTFAGRLNGIVSTYEYTQAGKNMSGRVYYLQADSRTVYALHFTGLRDRLQYIQNQTDAIARSFKTKQ
ncbi:MAG TPA: hypothetical protein VK422_17770 [Pyrinomonadaceae bacterium]|nr:hypothetical protein [Pyrinomonadaceae bacterium]